MFSRSAAVALMVLVPGVVLAQECNLDHASYAEPRSGATIEFRAKDPTTDPALMVVLFDMRLPNIDEVYHGDVMWNAGSNARPDSFIPRQCRPADIEEGMESCKLWDGSVFSLGNATADILAHGDKPAPPAILLENFGRALYWSVVFEEANPTVGGFDVFKLTGCRTE